MIEETTNDARCDACGQKATCLWHLSGKRYCGACIDLEKSKEGYVYNMPFVYYDGPYPFKCPACNGTGKVSRPPHIPGDATWWPANSTGVLYDCRACGASGIVWYPPE